MVKIDPCCGNSLQTGAKLIAIISLLWTLILIVAEIALLVSNGLSGVEILNPEFTEDKHNIAMNSNLTSAVLRKKTMFSIPFLDIVMSFGWIVSWILDIVFSIILYQGARSKSITLCMIWFYFRCAAVVFRIVFLLIYLIAGYSVITKIPVIALIIFRIYSLLVVNEFVKQIQQEKLSMNNVINIPSVVISYDESPKTKTKQANNDTNTNGSPDEGVENPMYYKN